MRRSCIVVSGLLLAGCAVPNTIESLGAAAPPAEFGRPAWVRTTAGVGAWCGGILGGAVSIVLLPVTWPISALAGDSLGEQGKDEFLFFPALSLAAVGHSVFGVPPDLLDYAFRRAWSSTPDPVNSYEWVAMPGVAMPKPVPMPEPAPSTPKQ